jgi:hypothetical protein
MGWAGRAVKCRWAARLRGREGGRRST